MKKLLIPVLFIGTCIMIYVMGKTSTTLKTTATPCGILNLEFAYSETKATNILMAWAPNTAIDNITVAIKNTRYDFLFLFFYAAFLFVTCKKIALIKNSKAGIIIANGAVAAGLLDMVENVGMLITLSGNTSGTIALFTVIFSVIKWILALTALAYFIAGIIYLIRHKKFALLFT